MIPILFKNQKKKENVMKVFKVFKAFLVMLIMVLPFFGMALPQISIPQIAPGQIEGLGPGTTTWLVQQARAGAPGFQVWTNGSLYTFLGPVGGHIGWATLEMGTPGLLAKNMMTNGGNLAASSTVNELLDCLKAYGWTKIPVQEIATSLWAGPVGVACYIVKLLRRRGRKEAT